MPLSNQQNWVLISPPLLHAEFTTHLNYLRCINYLSQNLSISTNNSVGTSSSRMCRLVVKKKTLVDLTKDNLDAELAQINNFIDYSQICISWVPVKSYYLFFNLLILLLYLVTDEERWLTEDHGKIHRKFKDLIRSGDIIITPSTFNTIYIPTRILSWSIPTGNNVVINNLNYGLLEKQLIRKMFAYSKEEYKRIRGLKSLRGLNNQNFLNSTTINLCEFFYWYRLKANYRDMDFVNSNVSIRDFHLFYSEYYNLTINFYNTMTAEINRLAQIRFQQVIF